MSKNSSSASQKEMMPAGKPATSFVTETGKSGDLGSSPISFDTLKAPGGDTSKSMTTEEFGSNGGDSFDGVSEITPQGEPASSFVNTSAVK